MAGNDRTNWLSATEKSAALDRIGYYRYRGSVPKPTIDHWNVLNWFVKLANMRTPFEELPQAAFDLLTQEYRALQEENHQPGVDFGLTQNIVALKDLERFRCTVREHVEQLADRGQTTFGPFQLSTFVSVEPLKETAPGSQRSEIASGFIVHPGEGQGLLHLMSTLLGHVGLAIRRCPHCSAVFLKPRRDATFCSRSCQANAYARDQREIAKEKKTPIQKQGSSRMHKPLPNAKIQKKIQTRVRKA